MKLLLLFLLLIPFSNNAVETNLFDYSQENLPKNISKNAFRIYIRPRLKQMVLEYYQIFKLVNPLHREFFEYKKYLNSTIYQLNYLKDQCNEEDSVECFNILKDAHKDISKLDRSILKIRYKELNDFKKKNKLSSKQEKKMKYACHDIKRYINSAPFINKLDSQTFIISNLIIQLLAHHDFTSSEFKAIVDSILKKTQLLKHVWINSLIEYSYPSMRQYLRSAWSGIFKEFVNIERQNQRVHFSQNIERYNFRIHSFLMSLSEDKGNFLLPKKGQILLKTLQNRWNQVIKIAIKF